MQRVCGLVAALLFDRSRREFLKANMGLKCQVRCPGEALRLYLLQVCLFCSY